MANVNLSSLPDNLNIRGVSDEPIIYTDFGGNDTYTILSDLQNDVTINDNDGATINLPPGFDPEAVQFAPNGVRFTVNGHNVTVNTTDPDSLQFQFGGIPTNPDQGTSRSLAETANAFGASLPDSGTTSPMDNPGTVQADGSVATSSEGSDGSDGSGSDGSGSDGSGSEGSETPASGGSGGETFNLTSGPDDVDAGGGDDLIAGTVSDQVNRDTFAPGDEINGGPGTDTLEVELSGSNFDGNVDVRQVERTFVETTDDTPRQFSAETLFGQESDIQQLWVEDLSQRDDQAGTMLVTDIRTEDITLGIKDSGGNVTDAGGTADTTFEINQDFFQDGGDIGLALNDARNVAVDIVTGPISELDTVNVLSIGSTPRDNILAGTFAADGTPSDMNVTGDRGLHARLAANFTDFDASSASGDQTIIFLSADPVTASGGSGNDTFDFAAQVTAGKAHEATTGKGNDTVTAGDGDLIADLGPGQDSLTAGDGDMAITTGPGDDTVSAGDGKHDVSLGMGNNILTLGDGDSMVSAGDGDDTIALGDGDHDITAGGGANDIDVGDASASTTSITTGDGPDSITTGDGAFDIDAGDGNDDVTTGDGNFDVDVGDGTNTVNLGNTETGTSEVDGGDGVDTVTTGYGPVDVDTGGGNDDIDVGDAKDGRTTVEAGDGNDTVGIDDGDTTVELGDGNDDLSIASASFLTTDDSLNGGEGDDTLSIGVQPGDDIRTSESRGVSGFETIELNGNGGLFEVQDRLFDNNGLGTVRVNGNDNTVSVEEVSSVRDVAIEERGGAGEAYDTRVIGTDDQLDGFDHVDLGGGTDVLEVVDEAELSADDLEELSGVDVLNLTSDSSQAQTWTVDLTNELFNQTDSGRLTIEGDANVPANSLLRIDVSNVDTSSGAPGALQVENSANLNVAFIEDGDPVAVPGYANVEAGLTLTQNTDTLDGPQGNADGIDDGSNIVVAPTADVFNSSDTIEAQGQPPFSFAQGGDELRMKFNPDLLDTAGVANPGTDTDDPDSNSGFLSQVFGEDVASDDNEGAGGATVDNFERISFSFPDGAVGRDVSFVDDVTGDPETATNGDSDNQDYFEGNGNISDTGQAIFETGAGDDYISTFQWNSTNTNGGDDVVELFDLGDGGEGGEGDMPPLPVALRDADDNGVLDGLEGLDLSNTPLADRFDDDTNQAFEEGDFPFGEAADVDDGLPVAPMFDPGDIFTAPNDPQLAPDDTLAELGLGSINDLGNIWDYGGRHDTGDGHDRIVLNDATIQSAITTMNMGAGTDVVELRSWDAVGPDGEEDSLGGDVTVGIGAFSDDTGLDVLEYASTGDEGSASTTTLNMGDADLANFEPQQAGGANTAVIRPVNVDQDRDGNDVVSGDSDPRSQGPDDDDPSNGSQYNNESRLVLNAGGVTATNAAGLVHRFEVLGTDLADEVTTGDGADDIDVRDGTNVVTTNGGDDNVNAGDDADVIDTGAGNDIVTAGDGDNEISTGTGDDNVTTGVGDDTVTTGDGNDTVSTSAGADDIETGAGDDNVNGGSGDDTITTGSGDDNVTGGSGDDDIETGAGEDTVDGNSGSDTISTGAGDDTANGGSGDDTLTGGAGDDALDGDGGDDSLFGNQGDDLLTAGDGEDTVTPGTGADMIDFTESSPAADTLIFETGADGAVPGSASGFNTITGFNPVNDLVEIGGTLLPAVDDDGTGLNFATDNGVFDLKDGGADEDAIVYNKALGISDSSLVEENFTTLRDRINNIGVESEEEEQGFFLVQSQNDSALYLYNENVGSDANVDSSEIQLIGLFEDAQVDAGNIIV